MRRDTGEGYRAMLERMAQESGIATPTAEDLIRLDRQAGVAGRFVFRPAFCAKKPRRVS